MISFADILVIGGTALATAMAAAFFLRRATHQPATESVSARDGISFLFEDGLLHHASAEALATFRFQLGQNFWDDLRTALQDRFPDLPTHPAQGPMGQMDVSAEAPDDPAMIHIQWEDALCWVQLVGFLSASETENRELPAIKACADTLDYPVWEITEDGSVGWHNAAYADHKDAFGPAQADLLSTTDQERRERVAHQRFGEEVEWFELRKHPLGGSHLFHAPRITSLVTAEDTQHRFVQTLAKTFAHLSVGLAIFDRNGRLNIFNPALIDLTGLDPTFLVTQPSIQSFFDQLREARQMPEPRTYSTWRQEIAAMIATASDGSYRERWTLEDGRTYAVQGRPHPDGATAFMIEDISSEVTLTQNFRTEVAQYEALLDTVDDPLVVFSISGVLTFCNAAYRRYWQQSPEGAFADITVQDAITVWEERAAEPVDWRWIISGTATLGKRQHSQGSWRQSDGSEVTCTLLPIAADATALRFSVTAPQLAKPQDVTA